jgi:hypothetical protein
MGLYERLVGVEEPKIPVHSFMAALGEVERGKSVAADVSSAFGLSSSEQTEAATLIAKIVTPLESYALGAHVALTNVGASYDAIAQSKGLGWCRLQLAGITGIEFRVRHNKVGTGTITYQLWNETDGSEVTLVDDAGAAGERELSVTRTFDPALSAGVKAMRVRAKSTVSTDDPVYYGASVLIRRIERLTSIELHEVLLLGEQRYPPLDTVAEVKARLGV